MVTSYDDLGILLCCLSDVRKCAERAALPDSDVFVCHLFSSFMITQREEG
jgi:hypothetical protein